MRLQPVDLLANVGLGGQKRRLLVEPLLVQRRARLQQQADLFGQALADGGRLAGRIGFGLERQLLDGIEMAG